MHGVIKMSLAGNTFINTRYNHIHRNGRIILTNYYFWTTKKVFEVDSFSYSNNERSNKSKCSQRGKHISPEINQVPVGRTQNIAKIRLINLDQLHFAVTGNRSPSSRTTAN